MIQRYSSLSCTQVSGVVLVLFHLSSEDSPDSEVRVNMFVNPASDPVMCGLEYAEDRIAEVEYANESMSALNAAMIGMNALHTLVHNVSSVCPFYTQHTCSECAKYDTDPPDGQSRLHLLVISI